MKNILWLLLLLVIEGYSQSPKQNNLDNKPVLYLEAEVELEISAALGEGGLWNHETQKFWWVDIEGKTLNIYDPKTKINKAIDLGHRVGTVVPDKQGNAIVALQNGIYSLDLNTLTKTEICNPLSDLENIRFNDGKCDPAGRLWVGSMHLNFIRGAASLYSIDPDGSFKQIFGGVTISNGIIWSNDLSTLYYVDTPLKNVRAWDYNKETGNISNERVVIEISDDMGSPDGMTIDAEGKLWIAHWGGKMIGRWDPDTGELIGKISIPAPNVTSCAFGGPDLDILYITTAGGDNAKMKEEYPHAGSVFRVIPGVKGVQASFFGEK